MANPSYQQEFWDAEAPTAQFSHPLERQWLVSIVGASSSILDYGCGYGRTLTELQRMGYANLTGFDLSRAMLERARSEVSEVRFVHADQPPCPLADMSFDLVVLFAVLTSIPSDDDQRALIADTSRLLRPGAHLYVSDLPLQTDPRRVRRYRTDRPDGLPFGCFRIDDGRAVMRHHTAAHFEALFSEFETVAVREVSAATMRGRPGKTVQFLLRKRP